jgi:predicted nucleotidyltransferase
VDESELPEDAEFKDYVEVVVHPTVPIIGKVFPSKARRDSRQDSDIDVLVILSGEDRGHICP